MLAWKTQLKQFFFLLLYLFIYFEGGGAIKINVCCSPTNIITI